MFYVNMKYDSHVNIISDCSKITYNLKQLWICIRKPNVRNMIIGILYRPPTSKVEDTLSELSTSIDYIRNICDAELIIGGDMNVNYNLRHTKNFELITTFERKYNLDQLIKSPTRIVEGSKSLVGHLKRVK